MEILADGQLLETVKIVFGDAVSSEFMRMLALFGVAAWIHSGRVRSEIRTQLQALTSVLREDLDHQKKIVGELRSDVSKIKDHLKL